MPTLTVKRWRLRLSSRTPVQDGDTLVDALTEAMPAVWVGNALRIEFAIDDPGPPSALIDDFTGWTSIMAWITSSQTDANVLVPAQTILVGDLDDTLTEQEWADGTNQHGTFAFDSDDLNISFAQRYRKAWLSIAAVRADNSIITLAAGAISLEQARLPGLTDIPVGTDGEWISDPVVTAPDDARGSVGARSFDPATGYLWTKVSESPDTWTYTIQNTDLP